MEKHHLPITVLPGTERTAGIPARSLDGRDAPPNLPGELARWLEERL